MIALSIILAGSVIAAAICIGCGSLGMALEQVAKEIRSGSRVYRSGS